MLALTHTPSQQLQQCQRTYVADQPIDLPLVAAQHAAYCQTLERCGLVVRQLDANASHPDAMFIEDTAIVLDELAIVTSMGTAARRGEPQAVARELARYRQVSSIAAPAKLEGGDVLRRGRQLYVGLSSRTDHQGIAALADLVQPYGYSVTAIPVRHCLHLKTGCALLPDDRVLVNPAWVDPRHFLPVSVLAVPDDEAWGANVLTLGTRVCMSDQFPRTADLLLHQGFEVVTVAMSEIAKAEGGVTCLSLVFDPQPQPRSPGGVP